MHALIRNGQLTAESFADFVQRLRHDAIGERVKDHCTADAIFLVQEHQVIHCIDRDWADEEECVVFIVDDREFYGPAAYWAEAGRHIRDRLNKMSQEDYGCKFRRADFAGQCDLIGRLEDHMAVGYRREWVTICTHLTYDAAAWFIARKKHDFKELRVYVDSCYWSPELKAIRQALMNGTLQFVEPEKKVLAP